VKIQGRKPIRKSSCSSCVPYTGKSIKNGLNLLERAENFKIYAGEKATLRWLMVSVVAKLTIFNDFACTRRYNRYKYGT